MSTRAATAGPYSERLMDHFLNPRNAGQLLDASGIGEVRNRTCGDVTRVYVQIKDDKILEARFQAHGCGPGIACASYLLERVVGKPTADALGVTALGIARALTLPSSKMHAAELAVSALREAVHAGQKGGADDASH